MEFQGPDRTFSFVPVQMSVTAGHVKATTSNKAGPSSEDWKRYRPLIKRLYFDEKKPLQEVVTILAQQGHVATRRMYHDRIKKWKLDKKHKEADILTIVRKNAQREAIGKKSQFRVRGRIVTMEDVRRYLERRPDLFSQEHYDAPTPSDVSCRTPSPSPIATVPSAENDTQMSGTENSLRHSPKNKSSMSGNAAGDIGGAAWDCMELSTEDERIIRWTLNDMYSLVLPDSDIPRPPSAPPALLIPERLFLTIKTYMDGSFEKGIWVTKKNGYCGVVDSEKHDLVQVPADFGNGCHTAINLLKNGSVIEFRRTFSKAFDKAEDLIRYQHPRFLECLLEILLKIKTKGYPEVFEILHRFVLNLTRKLYGKDHPLFNICELIGMVEENLLHVSLSSSWNVVVGSFEKNLGKFHRSCLDCTIDFIYHTAQSASLVDAECKFRRLLAQYEEAAINSEEQLFDIVIALGCNLMKQNRYIEAEELGHGVLSRIGEHGFFAERMQALALLAECQYWQGRRSSAERNIRLSIEMIAEGWGLGNPWAIGDMAKLEKWLREWGDVKEADELKKKIEEAVGKDMSDEQDDIC